MADENDIVKDDLADQVAEGAQDTEANTDEAEGTEAVQDAGSPSSDEEQGATKDVIEIVDADEDAEAADSADAAEPAPTDAVKNAEELASAPETATPSEKKSTDNGNFVAVGILSLILGMLLALPTALGLLPGGESSASVEVGTAAIANGTAATVNGTAIAEAEITEYITKFREQQDLSSDDAWGEWMVQNGYTVEKLRSDTIDYYVERELLRQAIAEYEVAVDESEIDNYISSIAEQVGGEEAFQQALEAEGLDIETYRDEIRFSLEQQALAKKVSGDTAKVEDEEILEIAKLYFPDSVDEKATSLDDVDDETVEQVRSMLESSALQEAFTTWMEEYRGNAQIEIAGMPEGLPYAIDLAPYEKAAAQEAEESNEEGELDEGAIEVESEDEDADIEVVDVEDEEASDSAK